MYLTPVTASCIVGKDAEQSSTNYLLWFLSPVVLDDFQPFLARQNWRNFGEETAANKCTSIPWSIGSFSISPSGHHRKHKKSVWLGHPYLMKHRSNVCHGSYGFMSKPKQDSKLWVGKIRALQKLRVQGNTLIYGTSIKHHYVFFLGWYTPWCGLYQVFPSAPSISCCGTTSAYLWDMTSFRKAA